MTPLHYWDDNEKVTSCGTKRGSVVHTKSNVTCPLCLKVLRGERLTQEDNPVTEEPSGLDLNFDLCEPVKPKQAGQKNKTPCYHDDDFMPFGKYGPTNDSPGSRLKDVPANYLCWLWSKRPITDVKLENYIHNNINALKKEYPDGIWT